MDNWRGNRADVYELIDGERDYQDKRWAAVDAQGQHPTAWLTYMREYLNKASTIASTSERGQFDPEVMANIRKVTALGVAAMEAYPTPARVR